MSIQARRTVEVFDEHLHECSIRNGRENASCDEGPRDQAAERVQNAYREGLAKQTRKSRTSAAKRATFIAAATAWMIRLIGGGGV